MMVPAYFFCAPALGFRELLVILAALVVLVVLPLWTYWRRTRIESSRHGRCPKPKSADRERQ